MHDLLEGLCSSVSKSNMLYTSEEGNQTWAKSAQPGWTAPKKAEEEGKFSYKTYKHERSYSHATQRLLAYARIHA